MAVVHLTKFGIEGDHSWRLLVCCSRQCLGHIRWYAVTTQPPKTDPASNTNSDIIQIHRYTLLQRTRSASQDTAQRFRSTLWLTTVQVVPCTTPLSLRRPTYLRNSEASIGCNLLHIHQTRGSH